MRGIITFAILASGIIIATALASAPSYADRFGFVGPAGMIGGVDTRQWECKPVRGNPAHEICRPKR